MITSMTAFGRAKEQVENKIITVEIKSVNSRYLDTTFKLPRVYSQFEDKIKSRLMSAGISRGKVEIYVATESIGSDAVEINIDLPYAKGYIEALRMLRDEFSLKDDITTMSVAACRDVFTLTRAEEDAERDWQQLCSVLDKAVEAFVEVRRNEGEKIKADIISKMDGIAKLRDQIKTISEEDTVGYKAKLEERIKALLADNNIAIDEQRILTECAIFADKIAIDEELVRLGCHFGAFRDILSSEEPVGRKLDFLIQEINRETNTIGSKANNVKIARIVVDVKSELEKIREQIQNLE